MSNRNVLVILGIILAAVVIGGFIWWVNSGRSVEREELLEAPAVKETIESIDPSELGLTLTARSDKRAVNLQITQLSGIKSIEYELSYLTKGDIPRGVIGSIEVKTSDKKITRELLLGTCSRNVCKYDEGVKSVTLVAKITKTDGKILQAESKLDF